LPSDAMFAQYMLRQCDHPSVAALNLGAPGQMTLLNILGPR